MVRVEKRKPQAVQNAIDMFSRSFGRFFESNLDRPADADREIQSMREIISRLSGQGAAGGDMPGVMKKKEYDCNRLALVLSEITKIPREEALAIIMPAWCKYMLRTREEYLAEFARRVWDVPGENISVSAAAQEGIARFQDFICRCGLAVTLREYGIRDFDSKKAVEALHKRLSENGKIKKLEIRMEEVLAVFELAKG